MFLRVFWLVYVRLEPNKSVSLRILALPGNCRYRHSAYFAAAKGTEEKMFNTLTTGQD
jgi:hypothetical protein